MMRNSKVTRKKTRRPKVKLGLRDLDHAKLVVLNSLRSPESQRGYRYSDDLPSSGCCMFRVVPEHATISKLTPRPSSRSRKVRLSRGRASAAEDRRTMAAAKLGLRMLNEYRGAIFKAAGRATPAK